MNNPVKNQLSRWTLIAGFAGGALVAALGARASAAPVTETTATSSADGQTRTQLTHSTATVTAVDHAARSITLKKEDGEMLTVAVPTEVKMFDKLKHGDKIDIDYYESWAFSLAPTGSKPSMSERKARAVDVGGGIKGRELIVSAEVQSIDVAANTVTVKGPHGIRVVHVNDPTLQSKLPDLKPGQVIQLDYAEATAASIRPAK
jgi:Cu/Ag efflux protein CusF